jgi:hypothetical protein
MPSLKELYEKAQATGKVEYDYFTGGGTSRPFNQTSIGFGDNDQPYVRLGYDPAVKFRSDDPTNTFNSALAATRDTFRITEFLSDFPNGPLFLAKQVGLQLSNPDTSYKSVNGTSTVLDVLDGPRFYNPLGSNTVAQVPSGVLGLHFTRHGLSPLNDVGYVSLNTTENNEFRSRLTLYKNKIQNNETQLNKYTGGPDSTLGLGDTIINKYTDSFGLNTGITDKKIILPLSLPQYMDFKPWSYEKIDFYSDVYTKNKLSPSLDKNLTEYPLDFTSKDDYLKNNIHARIGVTSNKNNPIGSLNTVDSINILRITKSKDFFEKSVSATASISPGDVYTNKGFNGEGINGKYGRDIIKFRIEALNNDKPVENGSLNTDVLAFRAYLENLTDNFNPVWKEFNYLGRGEPFYAYEKFSRDINFTFTLFAHSEQEMSILYTKLNYLMSLATPDYKNNQMRGNYIYLTIGDYIYRQPGVMSSLAISDHFTLPWEIALNEPDPASPNNQANAKHYEVPKYLKVQLGFKPIHNFLPKRINSDDTNHTSTFVTPNHMLINKYNRYLPSPTINTNSQEQQNQTNAQNFSNSLRDQLTQNLTPLSL